MNRILLCLVLAGCTDATLNRIDPVVTKNQTHPCLAGSQVPECPIDYDCPAPYVVDGKCEYNPQTGPGDDNASAIGKRRRYDAGA